ncbi:topoisomerase [Lysinibacillus xylanilyticus]|uniref:topoisomerase n=1 Tax=Lysinibacillus xylanilyticus TaxID=582475 RepID=UPI002B24B064|nr:topoisomerase [Lysinibacillus xylanilyticus]MEB2299424.1 topoisomerase [Lysinibacillus xylanilyticus]
MKQAIISGIVFSSILLVGCNEEQKEEVQAKMTEESKQEVVDAPKNEEDDGISKLLSELREKIIVSITEQTSIEEDSIAIMLGGNVKAIDVSVGFPKDEKVDDTLIQQIVKDSIKNVSKTENVVISEENTKIIIEKY